MKIIITFLCSILISGRTTQPDINQIHDVRHFVREFLPTLTARLSMYNFR